LVWVEVPACRACRPSLNLPADGMARPVSEGVGRTASSGTQPPSLAIAAACRLIDGGSDVYGIGTGPLADSIERDEIAQIYARWSRTKRPFRGA
jgi:hypothetical protein